MKTQHEISFKNILFLVNYQEMKHKLLKMKRMMAYMYI